MTLGAGAETSVDATMKPSLTDGDTGHHRRRGGRWCNLHRMRKFAAMVAIIALAISMACSAFTARDDRDQQVQLPTPDRSQVQIIDPEPPAGLTDPAAVSAYQQGYTHMRAETWFSAIAAYDEAVRVQPDAAGLYEARGTAYLYAGRHDEALADYRQAIELDPSDASFWRRRAHAHTIAPTPQPEKGISDATKPSSSTRPITWAMPTGQLRSRNCRHGLAERPSRHEPPHRVVPGPRPRSVQIPCADLRKPREARRGRTRPTTGPVTTIRTKYRD